MNKFLSLLPPILQKDETVKNLAAILDDEIEAIDALTDKLLIYANLNNMSEQVIDELALSFHMLPDEGYRFANTIEKKRELVRQSISLHRHKGTLYAVKEVLKILGIKGQVLEWFEYGGEPYHFKIEAKIDEGISEKDIDILETLLKEFKNVRSHIESITFKVISECFYYHAIGNMNGEFITVNPYVPYEILIKQKEFYASAPTIHEKIEIKPT